MVVKIQLLVTTMSATDAGDCDYSSCLGCMDDAACNYDADATQKTVLVTTALVLMQQVVKTVLA